MSEAYGVKSAGDPIVTSTGLTAKQEAAKEAQDPKLGSAGFNAMSDSGNAAAQANVDYEYQLTHWTPGQPVPTPPPAWNPPTGDQARAMAHQPGLQLGAEVGATASPRPYDGQVNHSNEEDQHLFGPTSRQSEHIGFGASLGNVGFQPPPDDKARWYSALRNAAQDPDAPQSIKDIFTLADAMQSSKYNPKPFGSDRATLAPGQPAPGTQMSPLGPATPDRAIPTQTNPEPPLGEVGASAGMTAGPPGSTFAEDGSVIPNPQEYYNPPNPRVGS